MNEKSLYSDIYVKEVFVSLFSIWFGLRTLRLYQLLINDYSMTNQ